MTDQPQHEGTHASADEPATRAATDERRQGREAPRLGQVLSDAREQAGLGLSDLAEVTHVRRVYLLALEEGRYGDLPEDVYARNFVRLYANAVGLDAGPLLEHYARERQRALGRTTLEQRLERDRRGAPAVPVRPSTAAPTRRRAALPAWVSGPWLPTLALVVVVVGLAVWGFNGLFADRAVRDAGDAAAVADAGTAAPAGEAGAAAAATLAAPAETDASEAAAPSQVRVDIVTDPPGATVTIDGFPVPGLTPLRDVPVTAREGRIVRAELDGFETGEVSADLRQDAEVALTLTPLTAAGDEPVAAAGDGGGALTITITDTTWLEVYRSTARNEGERLVYTTAQSGQRYQFEPPVFVYTGNAAGVRLTLAGQDLGPMGSPGAVLGRAFPE